MAASDWAFSLKRECLKQAHECLDFLTCGAALYVTQERDTFVVRCFGNWYLHKFKAFAYQDPQFPKLFIFQIA
jgi:hypothetical protein